MRSALETCLLHTVREARRGAHLQSLPWPRRPSFARVWPLSAAAAARAAATLPVLPLFLPLSWSLQSRSQPRRRRRRRRRRRPAPCPLCRQESAWRAFSPVRRSRARTRCRCCSARPPSVEKKKAEGKEAVKAWHACHRWQSRTPGRRSTSRRAPAVPAMHRQQSSGKGETERRTARASRYSLRAISPFPRPLLCAHALLHTPPRVPVSRGQQCRRTDGVASFAGLPRLAAKASRLLVAACVLAPLPSSAAAAACFFLAFVCGGSPAGLRAKKCEMDAWPSLRLAMTREGRNVQHGEKRKEGAEAREAQWRFAGLFFFLGSLGWLSYHPAPACV